MDTRPLRPKLAEAVAVASGWDPGACAAMLARDGHGEYILIYERGIDSVAPTTYARTPILEFLAPDAHVLWGQLAGAGLVPYSEPHRFFACASCDGHGRTRDEGANGEMSYVPCATCQTHLVFPTPPRITDALAFAGDFAKVAAFEHRIRKDTQKPIAWRVARGASRINEAVAMKGPAYRLDKPDEARFWALFPEL